ncbi:MAG: hypothetical protein KDB61_04560 [Planctomycetes bacterium]|nr:hypothetical protein [Planctomycetota bacterium]
MTIFSTGDDHPGRWHQPVSVPVNKTDAFSAACEMVDDLEGWSDVVVDKDKLTLTCVCKGGLLSKDSNIRIWVEGPDGVPNSQTHCSSESSGGIFSKDKANVAEFVRKLYMRIT